MFPIRDSIRSRRFPAVTVAIIAVNLLLFVGELSLGRRLEGFIGGWAVVPGRLMATLGGHGNPLHEAATVLLAMFLHGGILHVLGNMWFLWIFGDNVEDRFGRAGYAVFYVFAGLIATASQVVVDPQSPVPVLGASGAIAGVLGAYLRFYPKARVYAAIPIFIFVRFVEVPAFLFLGFWFALQLVSSFAGASGVAWWAHIAGFVTGLGLSYLAPGAPAPIVRPRPRTRGYRRH
jgi:membrane associated rhomboid family serine protease